MSLRDVYNICLLYFIFIHLLYYILFFLDLVQIFLQPDENSYPLLRYLSYDLKNKMI